jgi:hypothetical protein
MGNPEKYKVTLIDKFTAWYWSLHVKIFPPTEAEKASLQRSKAKLMKRIDDISKGKRN